jgi:hypothetical protein
LHFPVRAGLSRGALPFELERVAVVDEAIEDGIGVGGLADEVVPRFDGELISNQRRGATMPVLD